MARRPGPSFRALLFRCGEGAVCEPSRLEDRQLRELVFLSVQKATLGTGGRGPQAWSVLQGPAVSVWRRRRLWAFGAGRQTAQRASFLVGSESNVRLEDRQLRELVFLSVQKATLGTGGRGPQARSVLQGPAVSVWRRRRLWAFAAGRQTAQRASFLVGSESNVRHWGPWPAGPVRPSGPGCFGGAVCEPSRLEDRQLRELVFLSVQKATLGTGGRGPQARSVLQGPAVSVWRRRRLWAFAAGRQTAQRASFLVGSESNVRHWWPWPAGPVRPSGPCCFGVAKAPFVSLRGWKTDSSES